MRVKANSFAEPLTCYVNFKQKKVAHYSYEVPREYGKTEKMMILFLCARKWIETLNNEQKIINLESLSPEEKLAVELIMQEPAHIDKITQITKLKAHVISSILTGLELKGIIKNIGGQTYTI